MSIVTLEKNKIILQTVRLSFPQLWRAKAFKPTDEPSFSASFIMDKEADAEQILDMRKLMTKVAHDKWGPTIPKGVKLCLRDGAEPGKEDVDGYGPTIMFVSSSSKKKIPLVDEDVAPLSEDSGKPYAGCYVNASLRVWAQDNDYGKRVNAQLLAIQFVLDGEAFGEARIDVNEEFGAVERAGGESTAEQPAAEEEGSLLG